MLAKQATDASTQDQASSVDPAEVDQFDSIAAHWWDADGPFRPLHQLTPQRMTYLRDRIAERFDRDIRAKQPFSGLKAIDIGCGGGLVSEPLARLGCTVTGVDAGANNIGAARSRAAEQDLDIDYRCTTAEDVAAGGEQFDIVVAVEIIEHVAKRGAFVNACASLARPGGMIIFSTINRTAKAFALAIVGGEYILRWLPRGSHDWRKFARPSELARDLRAAGAQVADTTGLTFDPITGRWQLAAALDVNYFLTAHIERK